MNNTNTVTHINDRRKNHKLRKLIGRGRSTALGYSIVAAFLVVFLLWTVAAPMSTAAIAPGVVGITGQNKKIQHLEGGIVQQIFVSEGERVEKGQKLVVLNQIALQSKYENLLQQMLYATTEHARWQAEYDAKPFDMQNDDKDVVYPVEAFKQARSTQEKLYVARLENTIHAIRNIDNKVSQEKGEKAAANIRLNTLARKRNLISKELTQYRKFESDGLVPRSQLFSLEQDAADIELEINETQSKIQLIENKIAVLQGEKEQIASRNKQEAAENISRLRKLIDVKKPEIVSLTHSLSLQEVKSPIDGQVINLGVNTTGGVVSAGQVMMEIVPVGEKLLVESQVSPKDRDSISIGQQAEIRLSAFDRRSSKPIQGQVKLISADSVVDPVSKATHYKTVIEMQFSENDTIAQSDIFPGMQAEVLIVTGKQTLLSYLVSPIMRSFDRAMVEE